MKAAEWDSLTVKEQADAVRKRIGAEPDDELSRLLGALNSVLEQSPWEGFSPHKCRQCQSYAGEGCEAHHTPQLDWFRARTAIIAAFAGNQFGKSTGLVIRTMIECLPVEMVPKHLRAFKRYQHPCFGWLLCPTEEKIYDSLLPAFQEWMPLAGYKGGSFDKAWNGSRLILTFSNGSFVAFKTYKQHESTLGGARLHFVGYDEPPPRPHRDEAMTRLLRYDGYEMFAMTPLNTNTGWIRRDIFRQREDPDITVIRATMHDNPLLTDTAKTRILSQYASDLWRRAREMGDFVDVGGLIYQDFESVVLDSPPTLADVAFGDIVVSIDPGIRNAALIFGCFLNDGILTVFDEALIQDGTPEDYVDRIDTVLARWNLTRENASFVIDPAARQRAQVNAETVETALARLGVYCAHGQNDVAGGIQQIRSRIQHRRLRISPECRGLREEADDYAAEDREDGEFKPVKGNDHRLDALRYLAMHQPYDAPREAAVPQQNLGWRPDRAPAMSQLEPLEAAPMGFMS